MCRGGVRRLSQPRFKLFHEDSEGVPRIIRSTRSGEVEGGKRRGYNGLLSKIDTIFEL